jgi:hypothetical protein
MPPPNARSNANGRAKDSSDVPEPLPGAGLCFPGPRMAASSSAPARAAVRGARNRCDDLELIIARLHFLPVAQRGEPAVGTNPDAHQKAPLKAREGLRQYARHQECFMVEQHSLAHDPRVAREAGLPQPVTEHGLRSSGRLTQRRAAQRGLHTHDSKIVRGGGLNDHQVASFAHLDAAAPCSDDLGPALKRLGHVEVIRPTVHHPVAVVAARIHRPQLLRPFHRQGPQEGGIADGEQTSGQADPQGDRKHG